jgi:hypothetical protein
MPSTINASASSGLITTADTSSILQLQTGGTTAVTVDASQNVNFPVTAQRITGDFSNATAANRVAFQTSTVNGNTGLYAIPNGTATTANYIVSANSDPTNTSIGVFGVVGGSDARLTSGITGTGTYLPMTFFTGGSESLRLSATSKAVILAGGSTSANGTGITFPAAFSGSSDVNTLDDYEEGTFSPTVAGTSTVGTGTYVAQVGTFTKVGRVVSFTIYIKWTAHTGTGNLTIASLPFTNHSADVPVVVGYIATLSLTASNIATALIPANQAYIYMYQYPTGGGSSAVVPMDTSADIELSGTYFSSV